jgi:hypothetical protein
MLFSPQISSAWLRLGLFVITASVLSLAGCVSEKATVAEPPATCTKVGDPCTFSPGKLGLCVESANDSSVLVCQSQH